jgi:hypothetical protein
MALRLPLNLLRLARQSADLRLADSLPARSLLTDLPLIPAASRHLPMIGSAVEAMQSPVVAALQQ